LRTDRANRFAKRIEGSATRMVAEKWQFFIRYKVYPAARAESGTGLQDGSKLPKLAFVVQQTNIGTSRL
jgi:hypothetical protein